MLYDIYKSLISLLLLLLIGGVQAGAKKPAEPLISISGYVFDAVTEEPLKNVKITVRDSLGVVLKDSLALKAYESERSAYDYVVYQDKVPEREKYLITISAPGYATEEFDARISACEKSWGTVYAVDLGNIYLRASRREHSLSEITVTASKVKMIMKGDTIEYDATAFKLPEGSMLDNLIRELPGAQLDDNGRITVNGQFISELLVNGRNFFSGDPQVALRNLPAYTVKNVQVYRREPEAFRGLDVERDKSDDPLIMDVNLKKEYMGGWMANAEFGGGVSLKNARDGRWMGRVFAMRYNKLSFIAFHASANNLNDPDKAGAKGQWSKPQVLAGVTTTKRAGVEYNTSWADQAYCGVNSTFDVVRKTNLTGQSVMGEQFLEGGNTFNRSESSSNRSCWDINWRGEISRMFGKVARVWFATEIDYEKGTSRRSSSSAESNSMLPENFTAPGSADFVKDMLYYRSQRLLGRDLTFGVKSTLFSYIYCTKPGYFGLDANLIYHNSRVKSGNSDQIIYPNGQSNDISLMQNDLMPSRDYDFTIKPQWFMNDYKIGEKKNISWRLSYRYQQKYNFGRRTLEEMNTGREHAPSVLESGSWFLDEANSYHTTRREWNNGVEASFTYDFAKYSISFNGASDYCIRRLEDFRQQTLRHVARNDWKNSVSLSFASGKSWSPGLSWDFNAGFHQELPEMLKLLDVVDSSNPLVVTLGNSNLHREKDYSLSASVNYLLERGLQPRLNLSAEWKRRDDAMAMARSFNRETGVTTWRPANISGNWRADINFNVFSYLSRDQKLELENDFQPRFNHSVDYSSDSDIAVAVAVDSWSISDDLNLGYSINSDTKLRAKVAIDWTQMKSLDGLFFPFDYLDINYGIGGRTKIPGEVYIDTDLMAYCRRGYGDPTMNRTDWVWNLEISKSFGRAKQWTVRAVGFDLLRQLPTVQRTLNAQGRTEIRINSQPAYALLALAYRLDVKPKKK